MEIRSSSSSFILCPTKTVARPHSLWSPRALSISAMRWDTLAHWEFTRLWGMQLALSLSLLWRSWYTLRSTHWCRYKSKYRTCLFKYLKTFSAQLSSDDNRHHNCHTSTGQGIVWQWSLCYLPLYGLNIMGELLEIWKEVKEYIHFILCSASPVL